MTTEDRYSISYTEHFLRTSVFDHKKTTFLFVNYDAIVDHICNEFMDMIYYMCSKNPPSEIDIKNNNTRFSDGMCDTDLFSKKSCINKLYLYCLEEIFLETSSIFHLNENTCDWNNATAKIIKKYVSNNNMIELLYNAIIEDIYSITSPFKIDFRKFMKQCLEK